MAMTSYQAIFRNANFRWFWLGFTLSALGDSVSRVAFTWFVYERTRSPEALGLLALAYTGPIIIGGLVAGPLLDRYDRRRVMLVDNLLRGVTIALIPILHVLDRLELWHLYAAAVVYGFLMMISLAGSPSLVPSLVRRDQLATANALEMLSYTLAGVIGPPLAGWLIAVINPPTVVAIDALSYFLFVLALAVIRVQPSERATSPTQAGVGLGEAVRLMLGNTPLFTITVMFMIFNIGGSMASVWLPILADQTLGGGPELYGTLLGALSAGEVVSAFFVGSLTLGLTLGMLICLAQALSGLALLLVLFPGNVWVVGVGLALYGAFSTPLTIWAQTLRMQIIPEHLRGRTFALLRTLMQSGNPIGGALAGFLMPLLGLYPLIALSALLVGVPGLLGYQVKALRDADNREPAPATLTADAERA